VTGRDLAARLAVPARWYMGGLFLLASWHKIAVPHDFALDVATYGLLPLGLVNLAAVVLPWVEAVAGLMLLVGLRVRAGALLVAGMMLVFLVALALALAKGLDMSCGCFASQGAESDPINALTLVRDFAWLGLSVLVLVADRGLLGVDRLLERRRARA
jgi:putative oxidoreductase